MKTCTKCGESKPLTEYHRHARSPDGLKARCKSCNTADAVAYAQRNHEKVSARIAEWQARNRDKCNANFKRWKARHPAHAAAMGRRSASRYYATEKAAVAREKNRGSIRLTKAKYKVSRANREAVATPRWANVDMMRLYYIYAEALGMHVDHIVPIKGKTVCGLHWEGNFQLLTPSENSSKNNRHWPDMP